MNIAFFLGSLSGRGGIGRAVSGLANRLAEEENLQVFTVTYLSDSEERAYRLNNDIHALSLGMDGSMISAVLLKAAVPKLCRLMKENGIEVLIACGALYFPLTVLCARLCKIKCICCEHTSPMVDSDYRFQKAGRSVAIHGADKIVLLTKSAVTYYVEQLGADKKKLAQIYNPVDASVRQSDAYQINANKIISVGRLSYPKNFERLITLAVPFLTQHPDWQWDIYGDGELRDSLQNQIEHSGVASRLHLMGNHSDIYQRYGDYAFCVMTSRYEGFPMTLLEASANRLPMVAFDVPTGPDEIIQDGVNGFLILADSDTEMIQKLQTLTDDAALRASMSEAAYLTSMAFDMERIIPQWLNLLKEVTQN